MDARFLLRRAAPYRRQIAQISVLSLAGSLAMLAIPWLAGQLLGGVVADAVMDLPLIAGLLITALVMTSLLNIVAAIISARTSGRVLADLRLEAYAHVQCLPMGFHDRSKQGDLLALMTYEVNNLSTFLTGTLAGLPAMVVTAAGAIILLFAIDPMLALFIPVLVPVFTIALKLVGRRQRALAARARAADAALMTAAEEDLEMLAAIKAFAVEDRQRRNYAQLTEDVRALTFAQDRISAMLGPAIALVSGVAAIILILILGEELVLDGKGAGELFAFLLYAALLTRPVGALADFYGRLQWARGTLERLERVLAEPIEAGYRHGETGARSTGRIAFEQVSFAYPGRDGPLRHIDLVIAPGEIVALTGQNGAGKSTLINLLLRFYEPQAGRITLDGTDIAALQVQHLRRQIGLVPQRALLFNGSVRDNIAFGLTDLSAAQIAQAARLAQAEEFIARLPDGLETEIGDHGVRLSGGQRQRLALARALVLDPPILIFDEATSMYDLEGEAAFVSACQTALAERTVIIVTHRRASLALADRIIEIADGSAREVPGIAAWKEA